MELKNLITKKDLQEPYGTLTEYLTIEDIFKLEAELKGRQILFRKGKVDVETEYPRLVLVLGKEKALRVINLYSGSLIYFPEIRASCREKIKSLILEQFTGYNYTELARRYGYSERYIRKLVENKARYIKNVYDNQISLLDI